MARRKKPEDETPAQTEERRQHEIVADAATRSEKVSWERKMDNMVMLMTKLRPIEDQMLDLMAQKMPIIDSIAELRQEMVRDCVHPYTHLATKDGVTECKFCGRRFSLINNGNRT